MIVTGETLINPPYSFLEHPKPEVTIRSKDGSTSSSYTHLIKQILYSKPGCLSSFWSNFLKDHFSSVQSLSHVRLFATPWIAALQASLSITNSRSSLKLMSIESVIPSSHIILCRPLFLLPLIPPSIRVFSNESTLCMRWPKYWSFSFSIIPSKEHPELIFRMDWSPLECTRWISLQSKGLSRVFSNTTVQKHQFFGAQFSSQSNSHIHTWLLEKLVGIISDLDSSLFPWF